MAPSLWRKDKILYREISSGTRGLCFGGQDSLAPFETMRSGHIFRLLIMYCPLGIFVLLVVTCIQPSRKYLSTCLSQPLPQKAVLFSDLVVPDPPPPPSKPVLCTLLFLSCAPTTHHPTPLLSLLFYLPGMARFAYSGLDSLPTYFKALLSFGDTPPASPPLGFVNTSGLGGERGPANYEL